MASCSANNINCQATTSSCGCNNRGILVGTAKIINSHYIKNNSQRAVFFKNGGCDVVSKGYIPSSQNLSSNGPARQRICDDDNGALESEGLDYPNYVFNRSHAGSSF